LSNSRKLFYSGIVTFVFLAIVELALRATPLSFYQENPFFPLNRDINFTDVYSKDRDLFWTLKSSISTNSELFSDIQYRTNSQGFRGAEFPAKSTKTRVVALGNSCTFGWGVNEDSIYTAELQRLLPQIEALACGTPGYSSYQGKVILPRIAPDLKPDILLIMFGWNDHWPAGQDIADKEQRFPPQAALSIQNALSSLSIYKALRQISLRLTSSETQPMAIEQLSGKRRVSLSDFRSNLREIISYSRKHDILPVLLSPPIASMENYFSAKSVSAFHDLHRAYQNAISEVGRTESVTVIDLQLPFDQRSDLFSDAANDLAHFNAAGHQVAAKTIAPVIDSLLNATSSEPHTTTE
jgi:lysophospholipase L1-like esterase